MGAAWGLPAGAAHYSGGRRAVNTRFAAGIPVRVAGGSAVARIKGSVRIKEGYRRPGVHILGKLTVPALRLDLLDLDTA